MRDLPVALRDLPVRGPAVRDLALTLPPHRMPPMRAGRPLKRWRYLGVYRPDLMLCVGDARVAGVPQRWWAVALPDGTLLEGRRGIQLDPTRARPADSRTPRVPSNSAPSGRATAHHRCGIPATRATPTHSISSGL